MGRHKLPALQLVIVVLMVLTCVFGTGSLKADSTARHNVKCSQAFPCPESIRSRVNFWIDVYSLWSSNDAILHDKDDPSRVYRVLTGQDCGSGTKSTTIERQKDKIAKRLGALADYLEDGTSAFKREDRQLLALFANPSGRKLRQATSRIRCQSGNRDRFLKALNRYVIYSNLVRQTLMSAGLPLDIQYLPFVESLYNPLAYSRVGAAGLWQIMPGTARGLGLKINGALDERLDPEIASEAAARYLAKSYVTLMTTAQKIQPNVTSTQVSPFVITSYNYGVNGVRRAIERHGPDYSVVLNGYRSPGFQVAVKNFYASFLAARHVAQNADRYFGRRGQQQPLKYETVVLRRSESIGRLQEVFGLSQERLRNLNPALTRFVWHGWRFVPADYRLRLPLREGGWVGKLRHLEALPVEPNDLSALQYTVKRGDTACAIANVFQVRCRDFIDLNRLGRNAIIRVGQKLHVPPARRQHLSGIVDPGVYRVRRGDSVCEIAKRFSVRCDDMLATNGLKRNSVLHVGRQLVIPGALQTDNSVKSYTVRRGESACLIAARFRVSCNQLMVENSLNVRALIFPGQTLRIPGRLDKRASVAIVAAPKVTVSHTVRRGDTACQISERYQVPCGKLISANQLGQGAVIRVGQVLFVPGVASSLTGTLSDPEHVPSSDLQHTVREGDTACKIAKKYGIKCAILMATNNLDQIAKIVPGEKLKIFRESVEQPPVRFSISPLDQDFDLSVQTAVVNGKTIFRINAEPEETLRHYAGWLALPDIEELCKLNKIAIESALDIGDVLLLPITSHKQQSLFERRRQEYHRMLVEEFKETFDVVTTQNYTIRPGDSVWGLAQRFDLPVWIITRFNPSLRFHVPRIGEELEIPSVRSRSS